MQKLARLLEIQTKTEENKIQYPKHKNPKMQAKINRMNNVAKVKIILNCDNNLKGNLSSDTKVDKVYRVKTNNTYKSMAHHSNVERHLKSMTSHAKHGLAKAKIGSSSSNSTFKPQTTRVMPNLNKSNRKSSKTGNMLKSKTIRNFHF